MRDVIIIPFSQDESIVIASDNSGAIGQKEGDEVRVPYDMVAYYSFRVAVMECMAAGAVPFAVTLQNFCGEDAWQGLKDGIEKGLEELSLEELKITGSSESNFTLSQSAIGMTVLGKKKNSSIAGQLTFSDRTNMAVIGTPLVGDELVEKEVEAAPLSLFNRICSIEDVVTLPVGSKGILSELNQLFSNRTFCEGHIETNLDILKSSGPSTCFIAVYPPEKREELKVIAGSYFHEIMKG